MRRKKKKISLGGIWTPDLHLATVTQCNNHYKVAANSIFNINNSLGAVEVPGSKSPHRVTNPLQRSLTTGAEAIEIDWIAFKDTSPRPTTAKTLLR
jgi:hypothetical protein